ncbi:MAG: trypsin-like peptidase domain-containing protein [Bacteroidales bacterium]|nr:trypsin-like peptidase domain-containing protein [Bacteroidales bacterium]
MNEIIEKYKNIIIQIASPYGSGTGFYNKENNVFVTNYHVIEGNDEVLISGRNLKKRTAKVIFLDPLYDLAFIQAPESHEMIGGPLNVSPVGEGESIIAIGNPYGLKYTATKGIVSKARRAYNEIDYIQIDAAINAGNSGGPLVNMNGEIVGINTFIINQSDGLGFSLPASYLASALNDYALLNNEKAIRCKSCKKILTEKQIDGSYCSNCGAAIDMKIFNPKPFFPAGAAFTLEKIFEKIGFIVKETRIGNNTWELDHGSAQIKVIYDAKTRFVIADAWLCNLPEENILNLYDYLLRENYDNEGLVFSVNNQAVLLSLITYDDDINIESGVELFRNILQKADYYDEILINKYFGKKRIIDLE